MLYNQSAAMPAQARDNHKMKTIGKARDPAFSGSAGTATCMMYLSTSAVASLEFS
jgi:hypothetical protein